MANRFDIYSSKKSGLDAEESYIVVRDGISFLRILGAAPKWAVMTATASEDSGRFQVCSDRVRLVLSALLLCAKFGVDPGVETDWQGREYVVISLMTREFDEDAEEFHRENDAFFINFFTIFDELENIDIADKAQMIELYRMLALNNNSEDVYLGDGMWLSSDGVLNERKDR